MIGVLLSRDSWTDRILIDVLFNYADGRYQRDLNMYFSARIETTKFSHVHFFSSRFIRL